MQGLGITSALVALFATLGAPNPVPVAATSAVSNAREAPAALAVIVNPKNPTSNVSLRELRSYFKLERQVWPHNVRTELWLRSSSQEDEILLDVVYEMDRAKRKRYFRARSNRGEIQLPSFTPTARIAVRKVAAKAGAFSVVMASDVPEEGVKVLLIDGKKPDDADYPLILN